MKTKNTMLNGMIQRSITAVAFFALVSVLSGCGGGGGGSAPSRQITGSGGVQAGIPQTNPTPVPVATPTSTPVVTGDYFNSRYPHWTKTPIRVRFDQVSGITPEIEARLRQGMDAWKDATGGKLSYVVVTDNSADIVVNFQEVGNTLHGVTEGSWYDDGSVINMAIHLSNKAKTVSGTLQARIMAHEWGHALGLIDNQQPFGHSDVSTDRMSPVLNPLESETSPILSPRDVNTIKKLYKF